MRRRSILWDALALTGVNLLLRTVGMVFQIYLSHRIGEAGVGLLQLVLTVEAAATTFGLSGARVAAMYLCAQEHGLKNPAGVRSALAHCLCYGAVCSVIAGSALFAASDLIAARYLHAAAAARSVRLVASGLPVGCCVAVLSGYFTACGKIGRLVRVEVVERLASLAVTAGLVACSENSAETTCAMVILGGNLTGALLCAALVWMVWRDVRGVEGKDGGQMGHRLLKLCVPLAISDYLRSRLRTVEQFLIPWGLMRAGGSYEAAMAEYGLIGGMVFPVMMFPAAIIYAVSDLLVPELARRRAEGNLRRVRQLTEKCLRMGLLFAGLVAGGLFVLGPSLGLVVYGNGEAGRLLRLLAPMVLSLYMDAIVDGMLKGLGEQVASVRYNTVTMALDVVLLWAGLPRFGVWAYLGSFALTHLLNFALSLRRLLRVTDYRIDAAQSWKVLFCTATAAGAAFSVYGFDVWGLLIGRVAIFLAAFVLLMELTGALGQRDVLWLRQALRGH